MMINSSFVIRGLLFVKLKNLIHELHEKSTLNILSINE